MTGNIVWMWYMTLCDEVFHHIHVLSMKLLKQLQAAYRLPLSILVNRLMRSGLMPWHWHSWSPFTRQSPMNRPITAANITSIYLINIYKILEKVLHKLLYSFQNKHQLLCESPYSFKSNHSTVDVIIEFLTKILPSLDKREICLSAYLDLSNALISLIMFCWKSSNNTWKCLRAVQLIVIYHR